MSETLSNQATSTRTILVVEDSTTQALSLRTLLEREGLNVLWARDGHEGIELAGSHLPDLIVLDIQMPDMDGFAVLRELKGGTTATHDIPVIMFTRYDDARSVLSGLETGAVDYIPKDAFAEAVLLETLRQIGIIQGEN